MPTSLEKAFGAILKKYRVEKKLSQQTVAYESGLDRTYISLLERGERNPTITTVFALAQCLGKKPSEFIIQLEEVHENYKN